MKFEFRIVVVIACAGAAFWGCAPSIVSRSSQKPVAEAIPHEKNVSFGPVYFDRARTLLSPETMDVLNEVGRFLAVHGSAQLVIDAYADEGNSPENDSLFAGDRAKAASDWLVSYGPFHIDPARISVRLHGGDPKAIQACAEDLVCHAKNRRVEFTVTKSVA